MAVKFPHRPLWILLILAIPLAWAVSPVSAHALLVRSTPAANAVLERAPVQVELYFSEALEPGLSALRVIDANGRPVDAGDMRLDPAQPVRLTVSLHALPDGVYTVTWDVVSAVDGHQSLGSFPFAVGDASAAALSSTTQSSSFRLPFSTLLAKFGILAALALLLGYHLFTTLVWPPSLPSSTPTPSSTLTPNPPTPYFPNSLYRLALLTLLLSLGLGMLAQAGQTTGRELGLPWEPELGRILVETRLGLIWFARLALALLMVWLAGDPLSVWKRWVGFAAGLGLLFTLALTSHAATDPRPALPVLSHMLHLLGMTFWFGGLVYLLTALRHIATLDSVDDDARARLRLALTSRFSLYAMGFVALLGLTGLYSAYLRVGTFAALLETLYGHVLLVKQVFVAGLLSIAAFNLLVITPRLRGAQHAGASSATVDRFARLIRIELALAALLLGSVSFLTYIPPAKLTAPNFDLVERARVDDLRLELTVSPGRVGQNTFTLAVHTSDGQPLLLAKEVLLRFTPSRPGVPPSELQLVGQGDGAFTAQGSYLSLPGDWRVQAVVRRQDRFDAFADFNVTLGSPAARDGARFSRPAGALLLLLGMLCGLLLLPPGARPVWQRALGLPAVILPVVLGVVVMTRPVESSAPQANPIAMDSASIARGQAVFAERCAPCHGPAGKGDGPVGQTLNPRPADLTQHAIPGVHSDAQLFEWITNGFPGTQMPAFKSSLSDTDRWHLVNFIRTFADTPR